MRSSTDCSRIQDFGPRELGILAMVGGPASDKWRNLPEKKIDWWCGS